MATAGAAKDELRRPPITTHVLDTTKGLPVKNLPLSLHKLVNDKWTFLSDSETSSNGRCEDLLEIGSPYFSIGRYRIRFEVEKYFLASETPALYPIVEIIFDIKNSQEHYHLPLLLNPFGYSTYRGT